MNRIILYILLFIFSVHLHAQEQFSVFFASDQFELNKTEILRLKQFIENHKNSKIVGVYGFCDEDGSIGYNDTLAKKRIQFVEDKIGNKIKFRNDFKTRSFGKLHQFSKIKAENRKVSLFYLDEEDLDKEDEILGIAPAKVEVPKKISYPKDVVIRNPDNTTSRFVLDTLFMERVNEAKVGEKLTLENLEFQINTFAITKDSRSKLFELLIVMESNPKLKIDIQGHLCCMPVDRFDLSTQRAKAIYNFLVQYKIAKSRLNYQGFGSSQPIFPLPEKNELERAANRRVEILITEN
ncbi:OmpA family protein [Flavobacterium ardleyense]|uniref:OmpA family protein n=1 Tax=Flavobacterium ardleyense TaxID=2038737 RepID=UPI00298CBA2D|nr:OmpA family protein [Flavobacterium ardleyense]